MVRAKGGLCYKFVSPGNPGVPDRIVITPAGRTIYVELKTEVGRLAAVQKWQQEEMRKRGAEVRTLKGLDQVRGLCRGGVFMKFVPHAYQRYCIERIIQEPYLGLFQDMGLGKTVETLTAINDLRYNRWAVSRVLVVAPKKVAEATWSNEAAQWDHLRHLKIVPVLGTAKQRIKALYSPGDIWVINRENVPWLVDYYQQDWPFDMVVLDESSSFKNPQSKRFKKLRLVRSRIRRLVELTGTPSPNGLEDLWAQVYLLDEGARLGRTITSFREQFFRQDPAHPASSTAPTRRWKAPTSVSRPRSPISASA